MDGMGLKAMPGRSLSLAITGWCPTVLLPAAQQHPQHARLCAAVCSRASPSSVSLTAPVAGAQHPTSRRRETRSCPCLSNSKRFADMTYRQDHHMRDLSLYLISQSVSVTHVLARTTRHTHSRNTRGITHEALCAFSGKGIARRHTETRIISVTRVGATLVRNHHTYHMALQGPATRAVSSHVAVGCARQPHARHAARLHGCDGATHAATARG